MGTQPRSCRLDLSWLNIALADIIALSYWIMFLNFDTLLAWDTVGYQLY